MDQDQKKKEVAEAALDLVNSGDVIGVGTGSTADFFIAALAGVKGKLEGAVASSINTADRLKAMGIKVVDLNSSGGLPLYVDGADEATLARYLIKGGGGALTREKIVANASYKFVCILDDSKLVDMLGAFPLPIEVIPMAQGFVSRQLVKMGGTPVLRERFVTDNGNVILDVRNLNLIDPNAMERDINNIAGVVANGLFCQRAADVMLVGTESGVREYQGS